MRLNLNAGHTLSGADTGTRATTGGKLRIEEQMTRATVKALYDILRQEGQTVNIVQVDYADTLNESLNLQVKKCNDFQSDYNIVIHYNSFNTQGHGTEIFTYNGKSIPIAERILSKLCGLGFKNRGIKSSQLALINNTVAETIYIEVCFLDNATDMSIFDKYGVNGIALAIAEGILNKTIKGGNCQEMKKYRNVVVYKEGTEDFYSANILRWGLEDCKCVTEKEYKNGMGKSVYCVGLARVENCNVILQGVDRWDTLKQILKRLKRL